jgi:hypothetical protein
MRRLVKAPDELVQALACFATATIFIESASFARFRQYELGIIVKVTKRDRQMKECLHDIKISKGIDDTKCSARSEGHHHDNV